MTKMEKKEEKEARGIYNKIAEEYHYSRTKKFPDGWFFNELLEMPATLSLLGNVKGKKVLDFGCGTGIYAKYLTKKRAKVSGFDISEEMLSIARKTNPQLDLRHGSGYKIPFDDKFDIVYAALVLDYFDDWDKAFREVSRVLKKGGYFVFSIGNPVSEVAKKIVIKGKKYRILGINDYFKEKPIYANWKSPKGQFKEGFSLLVPSYHKTYETIINIIIRSGFEVAGYKDAYPAVKAKKTFPEYYRRASRTPYFCVWKVKKK